MARKNTMTAAEYRAISGSKELPSKMQPQKSTKTPTEVKMLQSEVAALWTAHSELLCEFNKLKEQINDCLSWI